MIEAPDTVDSIEAVVGVSIEACGLSIIGTSIVGSKSKNLDHK